MKRALAYLGVALLVLGVMVLAGTMLLPRQVRIERTVQVDRPPCTVFAVLDGWGRFTEWAPWGEMDPATTYAYSGPETGVGAAMTWTSAKLGNGAQEVRAEKACESIDLAVRFEGQGDSPQVWTFTPKGGGTEATWSMTVELGNNPFLRLMGTQMDRMLGPDFEKGEARLKALVEGLPATDFAGLVVERVDRPAVQVATTATGSAKDGAAVGAALAAAFGRIQAAVGPLGLTPSGPPRASFEDAGAQWQIRAMLPYGGTPTSAPADSAVTVGPSEAGPALKVVHLGPYAGLPAVWDQVAAYAAAYALPAAGPRVEEYVSDPATVAEAQVQTALYLPLRP